MAISVGRLDSAQVQAAVDDADLRVLLMSLVHLTGDQRWLEPPYQPVRDVRIIADEDAGFPVEIQAEIRRAAVAALSEPATQVAVTNPDDDLLQTMMSVCLSESVGADYVPLIREVLDFATAEQGSSASLREDPEEETKVLIVGAGISGLALATKLEQLGHSYCIIEKNLGVGGTWFENRYPGCGVDTPNHAYSFSFASNHPWKHYFSPREEIHSYLEQCATDFGVRPNIRFGTEVISATWDDESHRWEATLQTQAGVEVIHASNLVSAIGQLNLPSEPPVPGRDRFRGPSFHTAHWPEGLDLSGKRVAIVGTGASAMQLAPTIVDDVDELTIYQRSPQWARPIDRYRQRVSAGTQWLLDHMPYYASWFRFTLWWRYGDGLHPFIQKDPDWPHPERSLNRVNDRHRQELEDFIRAELAERPDLIEKCVPTYPPYGKRMLIDNGWFKALTRPTVELVTDAIDRIDEDAIVTVDGARRHADVIVFATGFTITDLTARLNIRGRGGRELKAAWSDDNPTAYLGITVPGFPNLFCMYGPNTNLGHGGSIIFHAECQARYISGCLTKTMEKGVVAIECRQDVHDDYIRRVDAAHEKMIWTHPGMSTWYRNRHGRVVSTSPWRLVDYWAMTREPDLSDYALTSPMRRPPTVRV